MTRDPTIRHRARELAVQWLYQWEMGGLALEEVFEPGRQVELHGPDEVRDAMARALVQGTARDVARIDPLIAAHATNWRIERMAVVDRLILRLAVHELLTNPDAPPAVIIDEALELTRTFSGEEAVPFVNGVLDAIRKTLEQKPEPM